MAKHRAKHRAQRRDTRSGRRDSTSRLPGLLGAAVLVVAGVSAVTVSGEPIRTQAVASAASAGTGQPLTFASAFTGTDGSAASDADADRRRAVSRDSQREALEDAADEKLQEVAEAQARERNAALRQLALSAEQQAKELVEANSWVLPIQAGRYDITAEFGMSSGLWAHTHTGLDFAAPEGTPILSVASGQVTSTGYDGAYGNKTVITLEDGAELWYCHQSSFGVSPGDEVTSGQVIGTVGSTGNSTGPHLHLEVRPGGGDPVDPYDALVVHGLRP